MPGDLKIAIIDLAPTSIDDPFGYGPVRSVCATVENVGDRAAPMTMPVGRGSLGPNRPSVTFAAASIGPMPDELAPGKRHAFILQNTTRIGQEAIYHGVVHVVLRGVEDDARDSSARSSRMVIQNPT